MKQDITYILGFDVYTDKGIKIGRVEDVIIDTDSGKIKELALTDVHKELKDPSKRGLLIPFRWILSIGEIIIVKLPIDLDTHKKTEIAEEEKIDKVK